MPFTKETGKYYGDIGNKTKRAKNEQFEKLLLWLMGDGGRQYQELLAKQSNAIKLSEPEREFMDRYETLIEYHAPKLARTVDKSGNDVQKVEFIIRTPDAN